MTDQYTLQDPATQYPGPEFEAQQQPAPGLAKDMTDPKPDHGEQTYRGTGRLTDRKAIVTGADSGIGRAVAIAFAREGADVVLSYLPAEEDDAKEVVALVEEAGRKAVAVPGDLLAWDVITAVSETYQSIGGRYIDTITNVGCRNPTKIQGTRLSLYPVNLEITPDTYAPTIKSWKAQVTVNNDAVFARLVQSLWNDVAASRRESACTTADPTPANGGAPLSEALCQRLSELWGSADQKINECVRAAFLPTTPTAVAACNLARQRVVQYAAELPASPSGPDVANRLGEQKTRLATWLHVWDTRYIPSIQSQGFCRETGKCDP